uniref:Microtubule-associated protein Jupiter n=1 Tax=Musca domestica TaxID=7370 RepID=T1PGJ8_MUSDO
MTSTQTSVTMTSNSRPSSRVLKPPGGGHSNIFAEPDVSVNAPRPKYNQQNSSNLNACMGSTDPNVVVEKLREEVQHKKETASVDGDSVKGEQTNSAKQATANGNGAAAAADAGGAAPARGRVPPGGFSSGSFW